MKIGVIGGGAVGLLVAALLETDGHSITIYVRREQQKKALSSNRLLFHPAGKAIKTNIRVIGEVVEEDLLIVCVKQYQLYEVISAVKHLSSPLLFLQNGMGHTEFLKDLKEKSPVFLGIVEHGAVRIDDYIVKQTGKGRIRFSPYNQRAKISAEVVQSLDSHSFPVVFEEDWYWMLTNKLLLNAVINPLTALFDVDNGELLANQELRTLARHLTVEICGILGMKIDEQWQRVREICTITAVNMSSMRADIKKSRQTEIEGLAGYLLCQATEPAPYVQFTYHAIKALEHKGGWEI